MAEAEPFVPDPRVQEVAEAYARDAVDFASKQFGRELDGSDESIGQLELILDSFHRQYLNDRPTEEQVYSFAKGFGSYVGEVYRRNHGATWGLVTLNGDTMPGLQTTKGVLFWPWGRVNNRIMNGEADNVWHYYQTLVNDSDPEHAKPLRWDPPAPEKRSWWKKWIGA